MRVTSVNECSLENVFWIKCVLNPEISRNIFPSLKYEDEKGMPIQRNAANARERARMRVLSSAFYRLKTIIPWVPRDTKLSKLDTLRLATNYISFLASTLDGEPMDVVSRNLQQPQKLVSKRTLSVNCENFLCIMQLETFQIITVNFLVKIWQECDTRMRTCTSI